MREPTLTSCMASLQAADNLIGDLYRAVSAMRADMMVALKLLDLPSTVDDKSLHEVMADDMLPAIRNLLAEKKSLEKWAVTPATSPWYTLEDREPHFGQACIVVGPNLNFGRPVVVTCRKLTTADRGYPSVSWVYPDGSASSAEPSDRWMPLPGGWRL